MYRKPCKKQPYPAVLRLGHARTGKTVLITGQRLLGRMLENIIWAVGCLPVSLRGAKGVRQTYHAK
jgi:hypothetical protein